MKNLTKPYWIFIVNTLPLLILFIILIKDFTLIKSLLDNKSLVKWYILGSIILLYGVGNAFYGVISLYKKKDIGLIYSLVSIILSISIIYLYMYNLGDFFPARIPQWMVPGERHLYVGTFIMPTILYYLLIPVIKFSKKYSLKKSLISFAISLGIPLLFYILINIALPRLLSIHLFDFQHLSIILIICGILFFLFFLLRGIVLLLRKKQNFILSILGRFLVALVLPFIGLTLNSKIQVFGNYSSIWFSVLALICGVALVIPDSRNRVLNLILFLIRAFTYPYTLYFFIVFIPFFPLSVVAIIAAGTGLLMLAPLGLMVIHTKQLYRGFINTLRFMGIRLKVLVTVILLSVIPVTVLSSFYIDKITLNRALEYIYRPIEGKEYTIREDSIKRTLKNIRVLRNSSRDFFDFDQNYTPYITSLYNYIVFEGLTISNKKIEMIEEIFLGKKTRTLRVNRASEKNVYIEDIKVSTIWDANKGGYVSDIDLVLKNRSENNLQEYSSQFNLPDGAWISDYYLDLFGKREIGQLVEKRSATWIYNQVKNIERRDPGILYYLDGNRIQFNVYPFGSLESRESGFQIVHKESFYLDLDGFSVKLGEELPESRIESNGVVYLSSKYKEEMQHIYRDVKYKFIIDTSKGSRERTGDYINRIKFYLESNNLDMDSAELIFTNSEIKRVNYKEYLNSKTYLVYKGGFFADRAIKTLLIESFNTSFYNMIFIVTDNLSNSVIEENYLDYKFLYPESSNFFTLKKGNNVGVHSFENRSIKELKAEPEYFNVKLYQGKSGGKTYIRDDGEGSIALLNKIKSSVSTPLEIQGLWMSYLLHPDSNKLLNLVKSSFYSGIMTPVTSFIVLENEAQREALRRKQEDVLNGTNLLDLQEEVIIMSEPENFYIIFLVIISFIFFCKRKL